MMSNLRPYFVSAALLAATAAHAESARYEPLPFGTYSTQESATRQESAREAKAGDSGDQGSAGSGSGEPRGSPSQEQEPDGNTVKMITRDPSDPFLQQIWTGP